MSKIETLQDVFIHEISDMLSAEQQLVRALPKMAAAAWNEDLKKAFATHVLETQVQIERIEAVLLLLGITPKREKCNAVEGMVIESQEIINEIEQGPLRDAALIVAVQKVEHYEIAGYGSLCQLAQQLGYAEAKDILGQTLEEEKGTDEKLTVLAVGGINGGAEIAASSRL